MTITRREALARLVAITGTAAIGAEYFLSGCARSDKATATPFTPAEIALLDEIGETIIPATDTPGAKAVGIGAFMVMMVNDCYDSANHLAFQRGIATIDAASRKEFGKDFMAASPEQRTTLLNGVDKEQRAAARQRVAGAAPHYFRLMKELTLLGFFSSEIGATQALRYVESPGAFHGDVPYKKGDRAWVNPSRRVG